MEAIADACRLLGDETRLRLLRILGREELNVTELTAILGISQSGVSRHLKLLREAGLVLERREGTWVYYALRRDGDGPAACFWASANQLLEAEHGAAGHADRDPAGDLARLEEVLRQRRERASSPFDRAGEHLPVPGRSWIAWARALLHLLPAVRIADVGCGDGGLALELARFAAEVFAIDRSPMMLERARSRATAAAITNIRFQQGELEEIPLGDASVDMCVLSQILHHAAQPQLALQEAQRILVPGGRLLLLDLMPHQEEWVRERLGDQWLGFAPDKLRAMLAATGFARLHTEPVPRRHGEAFEVLIASAIRPPTGATVMTPS